MATHPPMPAEAENQSRPDTTVGEPGKDPGAAGDQASAVAPQAVDGGRPIAEMRVEIDEIDAELVRLIRRRTELSQAIGALRRSQGGPRIVYSREIAILDRFRELGPAGTELGMLLLSLGRGTLGRR